MINSTNDSTLRAAARCRGFLLEKRRGSKYCQELFDGYMIRDAFLGSVVAGERYQLTAQDVKDFLNRY